MNTDFLKKEFLNKYVALGADKFYHALLFYSVKRMVLNKENTKTLPINLELLEFHDQFIILYRREGDPKYLEVAKLLRKAAHKIYRIMLKKELTNVNDKFLNLVKNGSN